jgi:hypothetical protein
MLALCSRDGIGFMENFFMNLLKVFRYVMIVMLDWNLPHEGFRSLKFVAHITMPRNSVLILFGSRVGSLWVPFATEQPHQYVAWPLQPQCFWFSFTNLVVLVSGLYEPSIFIYVHCILCEGIMIYHLPLQVLESPSQSHHVLQEYYDGFLVGTKSLDIWMGHFAFKSCF